jgi:Ca-activated chloride channel family protein
VYPREVKDIFAGSQALLIGKYKGSGKAVVRLTGKVNGVARAYSFPLSFAGEETGHTYLPRLWAMRRIGYLTEVAQENGNNREVVDEIIALSKKYGIISAYTSFLVTDPSENRRLADGRPMPLPAPVTGFGRVAGGVVPMPATAPEAFTSVRPAMTLKGSGGGTATGRAGWHSAPRVSGSSMAALPPTRLQSFVASSGIDSPIYGDEGARTESIALGLASAAPGGKSAVARSKAVREFQWTTVAADKEANKDVGIKTVEDKTFYLRDGFWTDSSFDGKSGKPEIISFGSQRYFDLMRKVPGISKYLAVGRQVVLVYKGHVYKIVDSKTATG